MSTTTIAIILIGIFVLLLVFWLIRSRGNTTGHIDTTLTAVGAATEAVEDIVEAVTHRAEATLEADAAATGVPGGDVQALESASAAIMATSGAPVMVPIGIPAAQGQADNLQQLKGVGPKLAARLTELEILRFDQIAAWGPAEIEIVDAHLGAFKGRITRDYWIDQASLLAGGDIAGFEARFGKLDG